MPARFHSLSTQCIPQFSKIFETLKLKHWVNGLKLINFCRLPIAHICDISGLERFCNAVLLCRNEHRVQPDRHSTAEVANRGTDVCRSRVLSQFRSKRRFVRQPLWNSNAHQLSLRKRNALRTPLISDSASWQLINSEVTAGFIRWKFQIPLLSQVDVNLLYTSIYQEAKSIPERLVECIWVQHDHLHAFKSTQTWTEYLDRPMGFKILIRPAVEAYLELSYPWPKLVTQESFWRAPWLRDLEIISWIVMRGTA
jgi:hypothetical protein